MFKKLLSLLLMIFLGCTGTVFAAAAVYAALSCEPSLIPGHYCWQGAICSGILAVWCFIGIKKVYDDWYN